MKLGPTTVVHQASRIASRVIEGQAVVIVMDEQKLHTLNDVGTFVWTQAEERVRVSELAAKVATEYEVTSEQALTDVLAFTDELVRLGALEVSE
jgi:hypothetical protein